MCVHLLGSYSPPSLLHPSSPQTAPLSAFTSCVFLLYSVSVPSPPSDQCGTNPKTDAVRSLRDTEDAWGDRHHAVLGSSVSLCRPGWPWTRPLASCLPQSPRCWAYKCAPLCLTFTSLSAYVHGGDMLSIKISMFITNYTDIILRNKKIYLKIKLVNNLDTKMWASAIEISFVATRVIYKCISVSQSGKACFSFPRFVLLGTTFRTLPTLCQCSTEPDPSLGHRLLA